MTRLFYFTLAFLMLAFVPAEAQEVAQKVTQETAGVKLQSSAIVGDKTLSLRGSYLLRYKLFFKIYVAALYLPEGITEQNAIADIPRRIEFHYQRALTAAQLVEATDGTINRGRDAAAVAKTTTEVAAFNALYPDVTAGDVMTIDYHPDRGTTMLINNIERGTIVGRDFSHALFGIWIGDNCFDPDLKKALLGTP